jgi:hypothetical protein
MIWITKPIENVTNSCNNSTVSTGTTESTNYYGDIGVTSYDTVTYTYLDPEEEYFPEDIVKVIYNLILSLNIAIFILCYPFLMYMIRAPDERGFIRIS